MEVCRGELILQHQAYFSKGLTIMILASTPFRPFSSDMLVNYTQHWLQTILLLFYIYTYTRQYTVGPFYSLFLVVIQNNSNLWNCVIYFGLTVFSFFTHLLDTFTFEAVYNCSSPQEWQLCDTGTIFCSVTQKCLCTYKYE